jgi:hypothetical protein
MKTNYKNILFIKSLFITLFTLTTFTVIGNVSAQAQSNYICPNFVFSTDMRQSTRAQDVKALQQILNADYRTRIAQSGIGSKGNETTLYGVATRESIKKFQALFIELIGVADGKVNSRTRVVLNSICKSDYFTKGTGSVYDVNKSTTTKDVLAPTVTISAPPISFIGDTFRLWIYASEPIKTPVLESFIIDGGATLYDIRKENPTTYRLTVRPEKTIDHRVQIQIEAEGLQDISGNKMINASNEISINIVKAPEGPDTTGPIPFLQSGTNGIFTISTSSQQGISTYSCGTNMNTGVDVCGYSATTDSVVNSSNISVIFSSSENIIGEIKVSDFIVNGPFKIDSLRKVDDKTYTMTLSTSAINRNSGSIIFPAGVYKDAAGNKNMASAELLLNVIKPISPVATIDANINQGYGGGGGGSESGGGGQNPLSSLMQLLPLGAAIGLSSLLGGSLSGAVTSAGSAVSGAAGKIFSGGAGSVPGRCMCPGPLLGQPTIGLVPLGGTAAPGRYLMTANPSPIGGKYLGFPLLTPPGVCGMAPAPAPVFCINPLADSTGLPVIGIVPPPPAFIWSPI